MIPNLVHRIWFGDKIPDQYTKYWYKWRDMHEKSGWRFLTWHNPVNLVHRHMRVTKNSDPRMLSDIARLEILSLLGGIYVDCDVEPVKHCWPLLHAEAFVGEEEPGICCNAVIGATPHHPWIERLLSDLARSIYDEHNKARGISYQTGPWFITRHLPAKGVSILPSTVLYPHSFKEPEKAGQVFNDTLTIHHWASAPK